MKNTAMLVSLAGWSTSPAPTLLSWGPSSTAAGSVLSRASTRGWHLKHREMGCSLLSNTAANRHCSVVPGCQYTSDGSARSRQKRGVQAGRVCPLKLASPEFVGGSVGAARETASPGDRFPRKANDNGEGPVRASSDITCPENQDSERDNLSFLCQLGFSAKQGRRILKRGLSFADPEDAEWARQVVAVCLKHDLPMATITDLFLNRPIESLKDPAAIDSILKLLTELGTQRLKLPEAFRHCFSMMSAAELQDKVDWLKDIGIWKRSSLNRSPMFLSEATDKWEENLSALMEYFGENTAVKMLKRRPNVLATGLDALLPNIQLVVDKVGKEAALNLFKKNSDLMICNPSALSFTCDLLQSKLGVTLSELKSYLSRVESCPPKAEVRERLQTIITALGVEATKKLVLREPRSLSSAANFINTFRGVQSLVTETESLDLLEEHSALFRLNWEKTVRPLYNFLVREFNAEPFKVLRTRVFSYCAVEDVKETTLFLKAKGFTVVLCEGDKVSFGKDTDEICLSTAIRKRKDFAEQFPDFK